MDLAWNAYYWPVANYWAASQDYVREVRQLEGETTWQDVGKLVTSLQAIEAAKHHTSLAEVGPSPEHTAQFLKDETDLKP
jgi:hypothetical protein